MAHVRKGQLTAIKEWRKHLRFWKRFFWKAERKEAQRQARREATEMTKARPPRRAFDLEENLKQAVYPSQNRRTNFYSPGETLPESYAHSFF
jgi:hypothetical protein